MRKTLTLLAAALFLLSGAQKTYSHENHGNHEEHHDHDHNAHHPPIENLPIIPVEIRNDTNVFLSVTIMALCEKSRLRLTPRSSVILEDCLRQGLAYQVVATFDNNHAVLEKHYLIFTARPNESLVFCELASSSSQCQ